MLERHITASTEALQLQNSTKINSTHCNNDVPKKGSLVADLNRRPGAQENQNYKLQREIAQEDGQTIRKTGEKEREERKLT